MASPQGSANESAVYQSVRILAGSLVIVPFVMLGASMTILKGSSGETPDFMMLGIVVAISLGSFVALPIIGYNATPLNPQSDSETNRAA